MKWTLKGTLSEFNLEESELGDSLFSEKYLMSELQYNGQTT